MHVHQKKSIIDLIFYDSQNLLPLFSVHYIVNTDISLSFRVVLPFQVKNFLSHILGFYSSQHFHICFIPLGDNIFSYSYCRNSINFSRDNQTDVFRQLILNIIRIMGFLLAAIFFRVIFFSEKLRLPTRWVIWLKVCLKTENVGVYPAVAKRRRLL